VNSTVFNSTVFDSTVFDTALVTGARYGYPDGEIFTAPDVFTMLCFVVSGIRNKKSILRLRTHGTYCDISGGKPTASEGEHSLRAKNAPAGDSIRQSIAPGQVPGWLASSRPDLPTSDGMLYKLYVFYIFGVRKGRPPSLMSTAMEDRRFRNITTIP